MVPILVGLFAIAISVLYLRVRGTERRGFTRVGTRSDHPLLRNAKSGTIGYLGVAIGVLFVVAGILTLFQ